MTTREQANAAYQDAVRNQPDLRELAKNDLFFLMVHTLGRSDMDNDWCFARCREVQAAPDGFLDLWAREHYKSTIITVGLTIQDILHDPEITVGIFSHSRPIAKTFLRQIKRTLEDNQALKDLFPDILWQEPRRQAPTWSEDGGLIVKRRGNPKESTVEAWGLVDGQPIGKHFSRLVYDDVVTLDSVTSPEMINKTTDAWALSLNLGARGGVRRMIGTRYHFNDTYRAILDRKSAIPRIYPATDNGSTTGNPVFLDAEALAEKRRDMGPYIFGCQMLQDPVADAAMSFRREWFRTCPAGTRWESMNRYILVDPASSRKKGSDYTVMLVIGLGEDQNFYVLDGVRDRLNLTERANSLFRLHREYLPLAVGYEKYGQQADIEHIEDRMAREGYHFKITPLGGQVAKNDRILRLAPLFEGGRVYFRQPLHYCGADGRARDLCKEFLDEEFSTFPVAAHDDMLDCLARIVDPDFPAIFPMREKAAAKQGISVFASTRAA